jgi:tetratricopeptide (TPR) repeat protein
VAENIKAFFMLYARPVAAISRILDQGRLWFAIVAAIGVSFLLHIPQTILVMELATQSPAMEQPQDGEAVAPAAPVTPQQMAARWIANWSALSALFALAIVFVPAVIFIRAVSGYGSFAVLMRSDYVSLLMCVFMTWAAAYLPLTAVASVIPIANWAVLVLLFFAANLYFGILAGLSIRTLFGIGSVPALGLAAIGCFAALGGIALSGFAGSAKYYLMSPFLLYYAYMMFGSDVRSLGDGLRSRQHLQEQLKTATTNPRDADAHYQLGLIYQKRRQYTEAIARFQKAIEIDPSESDAQFQLGKIAREQGRFDDAIRYLKAAAALSDKLSSSEVWRELGSAYVGVGQFEEGFAALKKYTERRSYDPDGLFWYGKALAALDRPAEARQAYEQCIEAVDTMPKHRRAEVRKWKGLAKKEITTIVK